MQCCRGENVVENNSTMGSRPEAFGKGEGESTTRGDPKQNLRKGGEESGKRGRGG